jgi:riboflavin kinase/FMN adenylyltransferase
MKQIEGSVGDLPAFEQTVVTVGKFDGVHRGHQALLRATVAAARARGASSVAFTFDRHPVELLRPGTEARFLMPLPERLERIATLGLDIAVVLQLTPEFLALTAEEFARDILAGRLDIVQIVASESFRFGRGAAGTLATLREAGERLGFAVGIVPPVIHEGERISSSRVVRAIQAGDVAAATALLGRPYTVAGEVVSGAQLGRTLGFPTANLSPPLLQHLPADGVYVVEARRGNSCLPGVANLGVRPTVGGMARILEAHFLDFADNLYGETIRLAFLARLRDQVRFPSLDALRDQIARDVAAARALLQQPTTARLGELQSNAL